MRKLNHPFVVSRCLNKFSSFQQVIPWYLEHVFGNRNNAGILYFHKITTRVIQVSSGCFYIFFRWGLIVAFHPIKVSVGADPLISDPHTTVQTLLAACPQIAGDGDLDGSDGGFDSVMAVVQHRGDGSGEAVGAPGISGSGRPEIIRWRLRHGHPTRANPHYPQKRLGSGLGLRAQPCDASKSLLPITKVGLIK